MSNPFPPHYFRRQDEAPDEHFYQEARKVVHLSDEAIAALVAFFAATLPPSGRILDLMSSWRSHLPDSIKFAEVVGLGLNAAEMADNPQLDRFIVHNLNNDPILPFPDASFDAVVCTVSVQYLTQPVAVFQEVARVLIPDGAFYVAISNRCFPTKAVNIWRTTNDQQHIQLVGAYFQASGQFTEIQAEDHSPEAYTGDPLFILWGHAQAKS